MIFFLWISFASIRVISGPLSFSSFACDALVPRLRDEGGCFIIFCIRLIRAIRGRLSSALARSAGVQEVRAGEPRITRITRIGKGKQTCPRNNANRHEQKRENRGLHGLHEWEDENDVGPCSHGSVSRPISRLARPHSAFYDFCLSVPSGSSVVVCCPTN
jgi:hypothetical protein